MRLDAKRLKKDSQQYEQDAAAQMMRMAKLNEARMEQKKAGEKGHQQEMVGAVVISAMGREQSLLQLLVGSCYYFIFW